MSTGVIGQPISRVEGRLKVTGRAQYAAEIPIPGLRFALLRGSTIAHGRIKGIDTSAAEKVPGVTGILTYKNMPRLGTDIRTFPLGTAGTRLLPMQDD
ncbi:MAG: xanthine dehydrogenase family protein molybdopterin-binding subunit, partial [Acidobacteriaceae bacterium]|nr:xanthine dehydrogenase family protein molybdopterin-binding subunit [Acidobacteriaceae bacterium]